MIDALIRWSLHHRDRGRRDGGRVPRLGRAGPPSRMPIDVLPDLTAPTVTILAEAPGMAPPEMEVAGHVSRSKRRSTARRACAASGRRRRSASPSSGSSSTGDRTSTRARQTVTEKLSLVAGALPPEVEQPFLAPISSIMGEILFVDSRVGPALAAWSCARWPTPLVRRRLLAVPGVSQVTPTGGDQKQYQVVARPGAPARQRGHRSTTSSRRCGRQPERLGRVSRRGGAGVPDPGRRPASRDATDIGATVVDVATTRRPMLVRDVAARCESAPALKRGEGSRNGRAGRDPRHPEAARRQHARADAAAGRDAGRHPARRCRRA